MILSDGHLMSLAEALVRLRVRYGPVRVFSSERP